MKKEVHDLHFTAHEMKIKYEVLQRLHNFAPSRQLLEKLVPKSMMILFLIYFEILYQDGSEEKKSANVCFSSPIMIKKKGSMSLNLKQN